MKFQNVFTELKQYTDPVGAAVDALNTQFEDLINIFNEAGASASDFADLQKLYDLKRADAIKQSTQDTVSALTDFINGLKNTSDSPLNRRTVYENAKGAVDAYRSDITAGKTVDQDAFVKALGDFKSASQALNGSGASFFSDFDDILALAQKAKDNATAGTTTSGASTLAASPFASTTTAAAATPASDAVKAITTQTSTLAGLLKDIADNTTPSSDSTSSISLLAGFRSVA